MVVHIYNPSYLRGKGRRSKVRGQPGQKLETLPEKQMKIATGLEVWLKW
jgi:hypothetical protein